MSVARVRVKPDTLDDENRKFAQHPLDQPLFLNSIPKGGSHLLRNIVRMFVPVESQYQDEFIQYQFLQRHMAAFDPDRRMLSWGHLFAMDSTRSALAGGDPAGRAGFGEHPLALFDLADTSFGRSGETGDLRRNGRRSGRL